MGHVSCGGVDRNTVSRRTLVFALVGVGAVACGDPAGVGDTVSSSTIPAVSTTETVSTTAVEGPSTTVSEIPVEVIELLEQLDAAWTAECDTAATELARSRVEAVVEWAPSFEQALGSFGGVTDDRSADLAAFLERECPEAGSVIRFIDVIDDEFPTGDVNTALALSTMLELSLQHLGFVIGIPLAERLAPDTSDDAPPTPQWDLTGTASCVELETGLYDYYLTYIESLNDLRPVQVYAWNVTPESQEPPQSIPFSPVDSVAESGCDDATTLKSVLAAAADADAVSFVAEASRWGLISNIRDSMSSQTADQGSVTMSPVCDEGSTHRFIVTNNSSGEVTAVTVEATGGEHNSAVEGAQFTWSQDFLAPVETVTVDSTIDREQQFQAILSWVDSNDVTHTENVGLFCFEPIGTVAPDR